MNRKLIYAAILIAIAIFFTYQYNKTQYDNTQKTCNEAELVDKYNLDKPVVNSNTQINIEIKDIQARNGSCYITYRLVDTSNNTFNVDNVYLDVKVSDGIKDFETGNTYDNKKHEGTISIPLETGEEYIKLSIAKGSYELGDTRCDLNMGLDMSLPVKELKQSNSN